LITYNIYTINYIYQIIYYLLFIFLAVDYEILESLLVKVPIVLTIEGGHKANRK
jgi:hypothetical protein